LRTTLALSTIGLLTTLAGCGGDSPSSTASTSSGGHGGEGTTATGAGGSTGTSTGTTDPNPGAGVFGAACTRNGDCASLLCVDIDTGGHAVCTRPCADVDACPASPEWSCATKAGTSQVCVCQSSGVEVCDGQDNDCDGVIDGPQCPELVLTASGPIADLKPAEDKLVFLTDKTIEKLDPAGKTASKLRSDVTDVKAIAVNKTTVFWVQGTLRQMDFLGNAGADLAVPVAAPVTHIVADNMYVFYSDTAGIHRVIPMNSYNTLAYAMDAGDMLMSGGQFYWFTGGTLRQAPGVGGGQPTTIATGQPAPVLLAGDTLTVYWGGASGAIRMGVLPSYPVVEVIAGEPGISAVALDVNNVYWANGDGSTSTVWKLSRDGGAKVKIGSVTGVARHLVPSGSYVYFETGKVIWRSPI
jgi:hypothetical protein